MYADQDRDRDRNDDDAIDDVVSAALSQYDLLPFAPQPGKYTVLAGFALRLRDHPHSDSEARSTSTVTHLLSLGAGAKCLPASRLPTRGDALHDSHAEVIARRGAIRWFLEEVQRDASAQASASGSAWLYARPDGLYALRDNVQLWMYVSTVPCAFLLYFFFVFLPTGFRPSLAGSESAHLLCNLLA